MTEASWYLDLRGEWRPRRVRLLLIGESAPDDGGDPANRRFFYSSQLTARDALFRGVVHAMYDVPHLDSRATDKQIWLQRFKDDGVFLIDLVPYPINGPAMKSSRTAARRETAPGCVERAAALAPDGIIVCHGPSFKALQPPLQLAGLPLLHDEPIPFPLGNWRERFVQLFREANARIE